MGWFQLLWRRRAIDHVNEALNGTRKINPEQARRLGKMFGVKPALFL